MIETITYNTLQILFVMAFAPLYAGVLSRLKEMVQSKRGPSIFQPYWDIWKLFHRDGIPRLLPEMTYTATGFTNPVRVVFQAIFRPNIVEDTRQTVAVHFRTAIRRRRDETHLVERLLLRPVGTAMSFVARLLAEMHHARLNAYVGYVVSFLILILFLYRLS